MNRNEAETDEYQTRYIQQEIEEKAAIVIKAIPARQMIPIFKRNQPTDYIPIHVNSFVSDTGTVVQGFTIEVETKRAIELWYSTD